MNRFFRLAYYPALLGAGWAAFFLLKDRFGEKNLPILTALISVAAILIIHASEQLFPYRRDWNRARGDRLSNFVFTNLLLPALSKGAEVLLLFVFVDHASDFIQQHVHNLWPSQWPLMIQLGLALLITEFFFYWVHRFGHTFETLWKFHSIHHAVERVYWDNAGRFHPVDLFFNWVVYFLPLFLFGVSSEVIALFLVTNAITGLLEHANVDFEAGWLNRVFNTAQLHRFHHSTIIKVSSTNFGKVLCVWDQVFGSWYLPPGEHVDEVGVRGEVIPTGAWQQMAHPFRALASARRARRAAKKVATIRKSS